MLLTSLVCTGIHGVLQERTYSTYGPHWRENIFYTVRPAFTNSNIYNISEAKKNMQGGSLMTYPSFSSRLLFIFLIWRC